MEQFSKTLGVSAAVKSQAQEYCRLAELKCPRGALSSSCIAVICIELASAERGEPFDKVCVCETLATYSNCMVALEGKRRLLLQHLEVCVCGGGHTHGELYTSILHPPETVPEAVRSTSQGLPQRPPDGCEAAGYLLPCCGCA